MGLSPSAIAFVSVGSVVFCCLVGMGGCYYFFRNKPLQLAAISTSFTGSSV